ncbi:MAG: TonB-dependent receptor plug domain-containing protein [Rubrivivax sp.]
MKHTAPTRTAAVLPALFHTPARAAGPQPGRRLPPLAAAAAMLCGAQAWAQASAPAPAPAPATAAPAEATEAKPTQPPAAPAAGASGQRIEITGGRQNDTDTRRQSTAAKIVVGREEIEKFGDSTLGEVLRRLPGVTTPGAPGRGGPPRMRGLGNGYTQMLVDGQRMPPGFSLESLTPDQIERIEILRAPTAETGARAIAGTINIVTREGYRQRLNDLRLGFGYENGEFTPGLSWTHNNSAGELTYNLSANAFSNQRASEGFSSTTTVQRSDGSTLLAQQEAQQNDEKRQGLNLTTRLQWRLSQSGDVLVLAPSVFTARSEGDRRFQLTQSTPSSTLPSYDHGTNTSEGSVTAFRLNGNWRQRVFNGPRLELGGFVGQFTSENDNLRQEFRNGVPTALRTLQDHAEVTDRSLNLTAKLSTTLGGNEKEPDSAHSLVTGLEVEAVRRTENRSGDSLADSSGDNMQAASTRLAAYVQDEWSLTPNWALHAGLRWEGIKTVGDVDAATGRRPENTSNVTTPLVHLLWKPDPKGRDQVRLSLTRSYRAPTLNTLIAATSINSKFDASGPNTATAPDRGGNPNLKPELATGLDLAMERYLAGGGLLSANVFHRRINNLMRGVTALETVDYSPSQRWVNRQQNIGQATTQGLELEAKFPLDTLVEGAPRVELRANLGLFRSKVDGIPGPDNRLDSQAKATANIGADYRFRGTPLTVGGNLNWVPAYDTQTAVDQRSSTGSKQVWDAFVLWTFNPSTALRVMGSNLSARDYESSSSITTATVAETSRSFGPSYINWQARLELKL